MKKLKINQQKSSSPNWVDESGVQIPYNRTTKYERTAERTVSSIAKEAIRLNAGLTAFKQNLKKQAIELYAQFLEANGGKIGKGKGGATFFNFDRSIKVEVQVNEPISFDKNTIGLAKEKLDEFLSFGLEGAKDFVKPIIMEAFETRAGQMDTNGILGLRKHISRVNDARFTEAMELVDKAIRKSSTKEYFQVSVKDGSGEYNNVLLNFGAISIDG
ncbi:MAG: DUF3164 family protein [Bacteroidota bacterium]